jgi:hypothetical protein
MQQTKGKQKESFKKEYTNEKIILFITKLLQLF